MSNFFDAFEKTSKKEWEDRLIADLKGKDPSLLLVDDPIEELSYSTHYHNEDAVSTDAIPGNYPFLRGVDSNDNQWKNGTLILIKDEVSANQEALLRLNSGADLLVFKSEKPSVDWEKVLHDIQLEHIDTQFVLRSPEEYRNLRNSLGAVTGSIQFNIDLFDDQWSDADFKAIADDFKGQQSPFCAVHGFKVQQCGATSWQELAFSLAAGHEYLVKLMDLGFSVDEASACISFKMGIGSNYVYEIAKFRALRMGWARIVHQYDPKHASSYNCHVTAVAGHLNKSLSDPYTNLLRQTTEAMAAINAGIDAIVILPYDYYSSEGASELASRMAVNISSILKEESFLDKVLDPFGGSYSMEQLTLQLGTKAWDLFKELERSGGMMSKGAHQALAEAIERKRAQRIQRFLDGKEIAIGINKYPNPEEHQSAWKELPDYLGIPFLVLENEFNMAKV